jgi:hypothetical protein
VIPPRGPLQHVSIPGRGPGHKGPFCPAKPSGDWLHTDEEVRQWVDDVIQAGIGEGRLYLPEAVAYFAANCYWPPYPTGSQGQCPESKRVRRIVMEYAPQVINRLQSHGGKSPFVDDAPEGV